MKKKLTSLAIVPALALIAPAVPSTVQADSTITIEQAADNIESAIHHAMKTAGRAGNPTLSQLGGVQSGSTSHDAGGDGAGGGSSQSGSSSSSSGTTSSGTSTTSSSGTSQGGDSPGR